MSYHVGDTVLIRPDIGEFREDEFSVELDHNGCMYRYGGRTAVIKDFQYGGYRINIDGGSWLWSEDVFMPTGTEADLRNANKRKIFGWSYKFLPSKLARSVRLIPDVQLRKRIIYELKKGGVL